VEMSHSQAGSKELQGKLLKGHPNVIKVILDGLETELPKLMCNPYGNYLCSAAFQACSVAQRLRMLEVAAGHFCEIAADRRGTHSLQALISLICTEDEQNLLAWTLRMHLKELSSDANGSSVVQRALLSFRAEHVDAFLSEVAKHLPAIAHRPHGIRILKKCISLSRPGSRSRGLLLQEFRRSAWELVSGPCSNYAVQHALEEWGGAECWPVTEALRGRLVEFSLKKFSSNVVEHMLKHTPQDQKVLLLEELLNPEQASTLVSTVFGLQVACTVLLMAFPSQKGALEHAVATSLGNIRDWRLRGRMERALRGEADASEESSGCQRSGEAADLKACGTADRGRRRGAGQPPRR